MFGLLMGLITAAYKGHVLEEWAINQKPYYYYTYYKKSCQKQILNFPAKNSQSRKLVFKAIHRLLKVVNLVKAM